MPDVTFPMTYLLSQEYEETKERASRILGKYLAYPDPVVVFNDANRSVTFFTERLIPATSTSRPRVMLLFSNPHPHSIQQGMFLSPNARRRENPFWPVMEDAGWLEIPQEKRDPEQLANICLKAAYEGPFELVFYCYYPFPTDFPRDIRRILGERYFSEHIDPDASREFKKTIHETACSAVVTFNKEIFNHVSDRYIERYIERLLEGEVIRGEINGTDGHIPVFLTYPTGWRYQKQYRQLRKDSLDGIRAAICSRLNGQ